MPTPRPWRAHLTDERRKPSIVNYGNLGKVVDLLLDGTINAVFNDELGTSMLTVKGGKLHIGGHPTDAEETGWRDAVTEAGRGDLLPPREERVTVSAADRLRRIADVEFGYEHTRNCMVTMHTLVMAGQEIARAADMAHSRAVPAHTLIWLYPEWLRRQVGPLAYAWLADGNGGLWLLHGDDGMTGQAVYSAEDSPKDDPDIRRLLSIEDEFGIDGRGPAVSLRPADPRWSPTPTPVPSDS